MNRRELGIALIQRINGTFGNLLSDVRADETSYTFTFARLVRVPQIQVKDDKTISYYLDQHIMIILYITDASCSIWKSSYLNEELKIVYYSHLENTTVDELYEALRKAIGYNH